MEKRTPHYPLTQVKRLIQDPAQSRFTKTAQIGGLEMGFSLTEMREVVARLARKDFYKSMTTYADHRIWQDVYRPQTNRGQVYLKVTIYQPENLLVVSFKRR